MPCKTAVFNSYFGSILLWITRHRQASPAQWSAAQTNFWLIKDTETKHSNQAASDLVERDDGFWVITNDRQTRSVAKEQLSKEPQKHSADFFVLCDNIHTWAKHTQFTTDHVIYTKLFHVLLGLATGYSQAAAAVCVLAVSDVQPWVSYIHSFIGYFIGTYLQNSKQAIMPAVI